MKPLENDFGEVILGGRHSSGLLVHIARKPDFSRVSGVLASRFGSIDTLLPSGSPLPAGVAHFLEHQMFESEAGDVAERFARFGASSNAFTSFTNTCYVFDTSSRVEECVDLLLELVTEPHFTAETLEKERGVIGQEIRMIDDDPGSRLFRDLLASLYDGHPLAAPIAGSIESIAEIDAELLHRCHTAFYSPPNLSLCIAGDIDPEQVLRAIDRRFPSRGPAHAFVPQPRPRGDGAAARGETRARMDVSRPKWLLGIKDRHVPESPAGLLLHDIAIGIVLELLLSPASDVHARLLAEGLLDDSFGFDATIESGFGFLAIGADLERDVPADCAPEIEQRVLSEMQRAIEQGFDSRDFERARRKRVGRMLHFFDSVESIAQAFANLAHEGLTPFDWIDTLQRIRLEDVMNATRDLFDPAYRARALVLPTNGAETR